MGPCGLNPSVERLNLEPKQLGLLEHPFINSLANVYEVGYHHLHTSTVSPKTVCQDAHNTQVGEVYACQKSGENLNAELPMPQFS
ncbi:unnamed protein product [Dovyalis caffra]|uniref:Uncharacterized protein n=1 Tax=Dovyalis caffra TaxID=77055 RepID=A0AAV1RX68_9ROSI|nr:unnamed protein product [Dovyalis caffra]